MNKDLIATCGQVADNIEAMVVTLCGRGFTRQEAITMVAGMLSSSVVYAPFSGVVEAKNGSIH